LFQQVKTINFISRNFQKELEKSFNKIDYLWKVILRYDSYYNSISIKSSVILAFDLFLFTGILTKYQDILPPGNSAALLIIAAILLVIIAVSSLLSIFFTFKVISPYLKSPIDPKKYVSNIFFGHVSLNEDHESYFDRIKKMDENHALEDISNQTFILAKGIKTKYNNIRYSVSIILFSIIPSILGLVVIKVIAAF